MVSGLGGAGLRVFGLQGFEFRWHVGLGRKEFSEASKVGPWFRAFGVPGLGCMWSLGSRA